PQHRDWPHDLQPHADGHPADHHPRGGRGAVGHPDGCPVSPVVNFPTRPAAGGDPSPGGRFRFCWMEVIGLALRRGPTNRTAQARPGRRCPMSPVALALATTLFLGAAPPEAAKDPVDSFKPDPAWKELGKSLWFDREHRRLVMRARVVLREGPLEHLL